MLENTQQEGAGDTVSFVRDRLGVVPGVTGRYFHSHLGVEPRTFGLEVQRAIHYANGTSHTGAHLYSFNTLKLVPSYRILCPEIGKKNKKYTHPSLGSNPGALGSKPNTTN